MTSQSDPASAPTAAEALSALRLTRSISATWWYIALAVLLFQGMVVFFLVDALVDGGFGAPTSAAIAVGGLLWCGTTMLPLLDYRHRTPAAPLAIWRRHLAAFLVAAVYGLATGIVTGYWVVGVLPLIQVAMVLNWPAGMRLRVTLVATAMLAALAVVDVRAALDASGGEGWIQVTFVAVALPFVTVSSLWWWDVLVTLDQARVSEARLAATQERLRLATDVHDLQGHHLQVIALQLELAERLMPHDAPEGMEQLRAARASVDDARQGTRDLATRFRSVPLTDELANAVDLLRAGGTQAEATVDPDASLAPAAVLGPVIRETTTNVLRHGGGRWARLTLARPDGSWRYEIANDVAAGHPVDSPESNGGSGLDGIRRRAAEAGGDLRVLRDGDTFTVVVTVPAREEVRG